MKIIKLMSIKLYCNLDLISFFMNLLKDLEI